MAKEPFKFTWATTRVEGRTDTTRQEFGSWRQAGDYATREERADSGWRCVGIEREDSAS